MLYIPTSLLNKIQGDNKHTHTHAHNIHKTMTLEFLGGIKLALAKEINFVLAIKECTGILSQRTICLNY